MCSSTGNGKSQAILDLVDGTDFPRMTQKFLNDVGSSAEVEDYVLNSDDPTETLSALVREYLDPERLAPHLDEMVKKSWEMSIAEEDDSDEEDVAFEGSLADDPEIVAWMKDQFPEDAEDFEGFEDDEDDEDDELAEGGSLAAASEDKEGDLEGADDQAAKDWRKLQKMQAAEEAVDKQWFESESLTKASDPSAPEGPDPLMTVFGIGLDNPQPMAKGKKRKVFFPGQEYEPKDLNPYNTEENDPRAIARLKFQQLVRQRMRKDPFKEGKMKLPTMRDIATLSRFVSESGKIIPRRRSGISTKNQRHIKRMVKRARTFGLLPYTSRLQRPEYGK